MASGLLRERSSPGDRHAGGLSRPTHEEGTTETLQNSSRTLELNGIEIQNTAVWRSEVRRKEKSRPALTWATHHHRHYQRDSSRCEWPQTGPQSSP